MRNASLKHDDFIATTVNWKTYENIDLKENTLAINPFTNKLYVIGTDTKYGMSNLYICDILRT